MQSGNGEIDFEEFEAWWPSYCAKVAERYRGAGGEYLEDRTQVRNSVADTGTADNYVSPRRLPPLDDS
eukprot:COSAG02_NODE_16971_length_1039_cov_1.327660_2_plen_68_part_00